MLGYFFPEMAKSMEDGAKKSDFPDGRVNLGNVHESSTFLAEQFMLRLAESVPALAEVISDIKPVGQSD